MCKSFCRNIGSCRRDRLWLPLGTQLPWPWSATTLWFLGMGVWTLGLIWGPTVCQENIPHTIMPPPAKPNFWKVWSALFLYCMVSQSSKAMYLPLQQFTKYPQVCDTMLRQGYPLERGEQPVVPTFLIWSAHTCNSQNETLLRTWLHLTSLTE